MTHFNCIGLPTSNEGMIKIPKAVNYVIVVLLGQMFSHAWVILNITMKSTKNRTLDEVPKAGLQRYEKDDLNNMKLFFSVRSTLHIRTTYIHTHTHTNVHIVAWLDGPSDLRHRHC
jgi:hypothetical protein